MYLRIHVDYCLQLHFVFYVDTFFLFLYTYVCMEM